MTLTTDVATKHRDERRFDRGSWIALAFALFVFAYNLASYIVYWNIPTDGWIFESQASNAADPQGFYRANLIGLPSELREGDRLVAVNGLSAADLTLAGHRFYLQQAPDWEDGHILQYTIDRNGTRLTVEVPIRRVGPIEALMASMRSSRLQSGGIIRSILQLLSSLSFFLIGWFVFLLRPRERAAHALLFLGVAFFFQIPLATVGTPAFFYPLASQTLTMFFNYWTCIIIPSLIYLMLAFPRTKFPLSRFPRATVIALYSAWTILYVILYGFHLNDYGGFYAAAIPLSISGLPLLIVTLLLFGVAFKREKEATRRAQYKWVTVGLVGFVGVGIGGWFLGAFVTGGSEFAGYMATLGWLLLPICLAFAITRTRLFDIDILIRKTLVYSVLTALLALIYFGGVVLLQQLTRSITASSDLAIVVSTLAIAALFFPLRRRVQSTIDRRFYRRKYDATKTLAAFGATVRDEVELDTLTSELLNVVNETMQPTVVSLWLKKTEDERRRTEG